MPVIPMIACLYVEKTQLFYLVTTWPPRMRRRLSMFYILYTVIFVSIQENTNLNEQLSRLLYLFVSHSILLVLHIDLAYF